MSGFFFQEFSGVFEKFDPMTDNRNMRILFVDDEENILEIVKEYFQEKGYDVITADNGRTAAEILKNEKIDCCFTDINMPEMDGLELTEFIWRNDNSIPVVIMTGYPSMNNAIQTLKKGVVDFLIKPVNLSQMEICLKRVLRERKLFIENILLKKELESKARIDRLNRELLGKVDELNTLNRIMSEFTTIESSSDAFESLAKIALEVTNADEARLWVIEKNSYSPHELISKSRGIKNTLSPPVFSEIIKAAVNEKKPLLISCSDNEQILPDGVSSLMAVPLSIREKVFGVLTTSVTRKEIEFNEKELYYLSFMANKASYAIENLALYETIYDNLFSTLYAFVKAIEAKDPPTQQHSSRVAAIAITMGKQLGFSTGELDILNFAGHLHDIGKIGIRDDILQKSGSLTAEEFDIIKSHPVIGARIVGQLGLWDREQEIIRLHHERFDGTGYPDGLKGEDIPFLVRILSVADVYDAMTSDRIYRNRLSENRVLEWIYQNSGKQFDPEVVKIFMHLYQQGKIAEVSRYEWNIPNLMESCREQSEEY